MVQTHDAVRPESQPKQYICCPEGAEIYKTHRDGPEFQSHLGSCQICGILPGIPTPAVIWHGDSLTESPTAEAIIDSCRYTLDHLSEEFKKEAADFYSGGQWSAEVKDRRVRRPTLTVNFLPRLVALAIDARPEGSPPLTRTQMDELCLAVTLRNMDAQRAYNYMLSTAVELESRLVCRHRYLEHVCDPGLFECMECGKQEKR